MNSTPWCTPRRHLVRRRRNLFPRLRHAVAAGARGHRACARRSPISPALLLICGGASSRAGANARRAVARGVLRIWVLVLQPARGPRESIAHRYMERRRGDHVPDGGRRRAVRSGRGRDARPRCSLRAILAGASAIVFGFAHFDYIDSRRSIVPAWIPPTRLFWAWATGAGHLAAGLALVSGIQARLAARCWRR